MERSEFGPVFKELCGAFGKDVTSAGATAQGNDFYKRFESLTFKQWVDLCESIKDTSDKFPSRKQLVDLAVAKGYFDSRDGNDTRKSQLVTVECDCSMFFVADEKFMQSFDSFKCPGNYYRRPGTPNRFCHRTHRAEDLRKYDQVNGVIYIKDQKPEVAFYPSFLKD